MGTKQKTNYRLPPHVKPLRYKIMLRPDLENFTFLGEESIQVTLDQAVQEITIHAAELDIQSAEFIHDTKEVVALKISYNTNAETVTFTFPKKIQKGKGELKLQFTGILNDKMRGFYKSAYTIDGQVKHLATTQFESTDARRAFPSFDEPAQKAVFDVTLMIPSHMVAISNTIASTISEHESGYKVVAFAPTPQMSTYLLAFIVGEFESIEKKTKDNILVRVFTTPGKKEQAKFALDVAVKSLEFYNKYFGIAYPLPVLDMIAIPDFAAGAMENWGAVTYRESTILIDAEKSSLVNKQWVALVIAHELAHQWFGNLVTMEWWTHLWLNEGFASFIEYLAIDHIFPDWDIWTQFVSNEMGVGLQLDALENTHPIEVAVGHPAEISEIFDRVSYSKGAAILRMLHEYVGPKDFQKGLQHYLTTHAYKNAQTEDLWAALEKVSGKPVGKIMQQWTGKAGHPVITVSEHGSTLRLTQSRFFSSEISKKQSKDKTLWSIPLIFNNKKLLLTKKVTTIEKPKNPAKLNSTEASFVRVDYPQDYLHALEQLVKDKNLPATDRLGLLRDTFSLAQSGGTPTTVALRLAQSYMQEDDYTVWAEMTGHIVQLNALLAHESWYEDFRVYGRQLYGLIAQKVGWEGKKNEKHTNALLRGMVLYRLGSFGDKETIKKAQSLLNPRAGGAGKKIDPNLRGVVYNLVAENGGVTAFNTLLTMYKKEDNQQEKDRIGRALGLFTQKALLKKTLAFSVSKDVRYQNTLGIIASVWGNPYGRYLAWEFVKKNWQMLKKRYAGGHYFTRVFGPASDFSKKSDAQDIQAFIKKNPVPEAARTIAQSLEQINANVAWLTRDKNAIRSFLLKNQKTLV